MLISLVQVVSVGTTTRLQIDFELGTDHDMTRIEDIIAEALDAELDAAAEAGAAPERL